MRAWYSGGGGRKLAVVVLLLSPGLLAQRAFEKGGHVIYEDRDGRRTDLGVGFSPVVTQRGEVALIRGQKFLYGDKFDCSRKDAKNWIAVGRLDATTREIDGATGRLASLGASKVTRDEPWERGRVRDSDWGR